MSRFKKYNFDVLASQNHPEKLAFLKRAYKSKMSCSEFLVGWAKLAATSRAKSHGRKGYTNAHRASEHYEKLDNHFNFFGNYDE